MTYKIWTDGACKSNPGPGGWAWIREPRWKGDPPKFRYGSGESYDTNNRMELRAVIEALSYHIGLSPSFTIYTDSQYVVRGVSGEWKVKTNLELWKVLRLYLDHDSLKDKVKFEWVKGHAGNHYNELADQLAQQGINAK